MLFPSIKPGCCALLLVLVSLASTSVAAEPAVAAESAAWEVRQYLTPAEGLPTVLQSERKLPVVGQADVVVVGGGVAGVAAALDAVTAGRSVVLVEERNYLGHELTATFHRCDGAEPRQVRAQLLQRVAKVEGDVASDLKVLLYTVAGAVVCEGRHVRGVVVANHSGRQVVLAKAVVDATSEGRIAAAAGARFDRSLTGPKTVRRIVALRRPTSLAVGEHPVPESLGLQGNRVLVHERYLELVLESKITGDVARDLSALQAATLEKSFAVVEHLEREGHKLTGIVPAPEIRIDEMPVVVRRGDWSDAERATLQLISTEALLPVGVEGLVVTGRLVASSPELETRAALDAVGKLAGRAAAELAGQSEEFPALTAEPAQDPAGPRPKVREMLGGIEPRTRYPVLRQAATRLPVRGEYDVLIVGGGTSGAPAAIAAARLGARVALVEALPNLGGTGSNRVLSYYWGVPWKSRLRLELGDQIELVKRTTGGPREKVDFSGERKMLALQQMAREAGVEIFYRSFSAGALVENTRVTGAVIENAAGRHVLRAKVVIDATGHADVAAAAGAAFHKGRQSDGFLHRIQHGPLRDPTHIVDISTSYVRNPAQAPVMAIRESRRIVGDTTVSFDEALHGCLFPDTICRFRSNYDTHWPPNANQSDQAQDWIALMGLWRRPILGSIPYRSLLPKGLDGILVAGKAYAIDHDALIIGRMQPDLEHLGEAAGVAAALAVQANVAPRGLPVEQLQAQLVRLGVLRPNDAPQVTVDDAPTTEEMFRQDLWGDQRQRDEPHWAARRVRAPQQAVKHLGTDDALDAMVDLYLAGEAAAPVLRPLVETPNRAVREEAVLLLGMLGDRAAVPALLELLRQRNPRTFCFTLPEATSRPSVPLYWSAVILLGRFQDQQAVPLMLQLLADPDECPPMLASFTIVALGRIGDPSAVDTVRPYLDIADAVPVADESMQFERQWAIRTAAAQTLAALGDLSGIPVLIELLDADQALLRNYAHRLLEQLTGQCLERDRQVWQDWWESRGS